MKKLFLGSVALVAVSLGTSAAFAADRGVPAYAPPPPPAPVYTWNGCYVGASAGTSSGSSQHFRSIDGAPITNGFDLSGFIGGGQLGCNWQWGAWVFGIEGDGSAVNKSGQGFELQPIPRPNTQWISETQERWFVTARGRLGLTNFWWFGDKTMVYVTGGGAWAKIDASEWLTTNPINTGHQESNTRSGWTVGGGIEYALGYGWSVKSEFLYADFGTYTTFTSPPFNTGNTANIFPRDVKVKDYVWRAGMNYKFW
jgi:outer membrane immunogenic protein